MRSLIKYLGLAAIVLMSSSVYAQHEMELSVGYNVNVPTGSFKDFITKPAYKGFTATLAVPVTEQLSIGLNVGYNDFYQKYPRQVYPTGEGGAVSAVVSNSVQQMPLLIMANYTFLKDAAIRPYVGGGGGVNFVSFDQYLGEFDDPHTKAKWALKGEAGVYIPLSLYSKTALKIGGSYNYVPFNAYGVKNLDSWGIEAGVRFSLH